MDKWLWAYAASTIWPIAVLLCSAFFFPRWDNADTWSWIYLDVDHNVEDDDLAF